MKDKSWQTWTDFEKDLEEFGLKTSTAYRLDKSENREQQKAAFGASSHSRGSKVLDTANRKLDWPVDNENVESMYQYEVFYDEEGTVSTDGMPYK